MTLEKYVNCPYCGKPTIKILHQPFVARKNMTKSRLGSGLPVFTKERSEILCGCEACGKSKRDIEKALDNGNKGKSHEERLKRLKDAGLPTMIVNKRG